MTDFVTFARAHGLEIDSAQLYAGERIRRCGTVEHPRSTNGAYHWDGQRGWVFAWDGDARVQWFSDESRPWTESEKDAWKAKREAGRAQQQRQQQQAAFRSADMLRGATLGPHDYLHRKGFADLQGFVLPAGELLVPMRSLSGDLIGAQVIKWLPDEVRWEKKMLPGMKAKGAVLMLGPRRPLETVYCEGYATGLSIELAVRQARLNAAVMVCFSDSNMAHVASLTAGRRYVFADNDKSGAGERAAKQTGLPYCMADTEGWDANDLHTKAGLLAVQAKLMEARRVA